MVAQQMRWTNSKTKTRVRLESDGTVMIGGCQPGGTTEGEARFRDIEDFIWYSLLCMADPEHGPRFKRKELYAWLRETVFPEMLTIRYGGDETERKVLTARYFAVNETNFVAWMVLFDDGTVGVQADVPRYAEWDVEYLGPFEDAFGHRADGRGTEVNREWFEQAAKEFQLFYASIAS